MVLNLINCLHLIDQFTTQLAYVALHPFSGALTWFLIGVVILAVIFHLIIDRKALEQDYCRQHKATDYPKWLTILKYGLQTTLEAITNILFGIIAFKAFKLHLSLMTFFDVVALVYFVTLATDNLYDLRNAVWCYNHPPKGTHYYK